MSYVDIAALFADPTSPYDGPPCPECGCMVAMLDPTPFCLRCAKAVEEFALLHEQAFTALSQLVDMVSALPANRLRQAQDDTGLLMECAARVWLATETRP